MRCRRFPYSTATSCARSPTAWQHGSSGNAAETAGSSCGALALQYLLEREGMAAMRVNPLAPKPQHFPAKAKSVIFLFMVGAPSHIDTFDPKPALAKYQGQKLPESYGKVPSQFT